MKAIIGFIICIQIFMGLSLQAQDIPPVFSQFYMNPFIYNPAFAGSDGYASLYLVHRRQWMGIEGGPRTSGLSFHSPFSKTFAGGLNLHYDQAGMINTIHAAAAFTYIIPIGRQHDFRMGLSAGTSRQTLNFDGTTPEQADYLSGREPEVSRFHAKFGINYHYKNLNIGLASNNLSRDPGLSGEAGLKKHIAPLHDIVFNALYNFTLSPKVIFAEPYIIYHRFEEQQRTEGGVLFYYKNNFWTGGSYRSGYGLTAHFGLNLKDYVKFAYAYELGNQAIGGILNSTHELQIAVKLGKEKGYSKENIRKPRFEF